MGGTTHGDGRKSPYATAEFIKAYQKEYDEAQCRVLMPGSRDVACWSPPPVDVFKVNVEAAFQVQSRVCEIGIVIRDCAGSIMAVGVFRRTHGSAFMAEALTARQGLLLAQDPGFRRIILEGDSLTVVKGLQSKKIDLSPLGPVLEEGRTYLLHFQKCSFVHID
ncbi:hypothetical protein REPUB_Repub11eG0106600 [Reevesia pubescens]